MGKTLFVLELPAPAPRKPQAPPVKRHKDKKLYSRKVKHRKSPVNHAGDFFISLCIMDYFSPYAITNRLPEFLWLN